MVFPKTVAFEEHQQPEGDCAVTGLSVAGALEVAGVCQSLEHLFHRADKNCCRSDWS